MKLSSLETVFCRDYNTLAGYCKRSTPHDLNNSCLILRKWLIEDSLKEVANSNSTVIQYVFNQPTFTEVKGNLIWLSLGDALWRDDVLELPDLPVKIKKVSGNQSLFLSSPVALLHNPSKGAQEQLTVKGLIKASCYLGTVHTDGVYDKNEVSPFFQDFLEANLLRREKGKDILSFTQYDIKAALIVVLHAWWDLYATVAAKDGQAPQKQNVLQDITSQTLVCFPMLNVNDSHKAR